MSKAGDSFLSRLIIVSNRVACPTQQGVRAGGLAVAMHEALDRYERKGIIPYVRRTRERLAALQETPI